MNSRRTPDSINQIMKTSTTKLVKIQQKAGQLQAINEFLVKELIPGSHEYCRVANLRKGVLIIEVASGVWKTRLLQLSYSILEQMKLNMSFPLESIELKVNPELFNEQTEELTPNPRKISNKTAEHLTALAQMSPPKLAATLNRLASLAKRK